MKKQLDSYSMLIVGKYFQTLEDYVNIICVNSKYIDMLDKYHYNPIPITQKQLKYFSHLETQYLYSPDDEILKGIQRITVEYRVEYSQYLSMIHNYKNKMKAIKFLRIEYSLYDVDEFGCDIPQEVNMLGYCSFGRMNQEMLCIPDQIKLLSPRCCYESSFQKIMVSESIRELPIAMCYKCIQLQSIVIPSSIGCIKEFCFQKCTSLKSIQLPTTISYIGNNCFDGCSSLSSIQLPDSISVLNERIFSNCISLKHIHFPSLLTKIRHKCFFNCKSLSSIKYYPQDKNIHFSIPYHISLLLNKQGFICHHLKYTSYDRILCNNIIPDDIHSIEKYCFACLPSLKELTLPTTLTKIGKGCFQLTQNIENMKFLPTIKKIGENCFNYDNFFERKYFSIS